MSKIHAPDPKRFGSPGDSVQKSLCKQIVWLREIDRTLTRVTCKNCIKKLLR